MPEPDTHRLGYRRVDGDPNAAVLIETMDDTSRWEATRSLRSWERRHLALGPVDRLLDVGCGPGDAALALAADLGEAGQLVGVDLSSEMVATARDRASAIACRTRFVVAEAAALDEPDGSFDAARAERVLQWVEDPGAVVAELARVVRPGGAVSLIDTDWSTFDLDVGDETLRRRVREAMRHERQRPSNVGSRVAQLLAATGVTTLAQTTITQIWTSWDPDRTPAPLGCFSMVSLAEDLVERGQLPPGEAEAFVEITCDAARAGRFRMSLGLFAAVGMVPRA